MSQGPALPIREIRDEEGVVLISLAGHLCGEGATKVLLDAVHDLEARGSSRFVLDLERLERIDSAGLGAIASAYVSVTRSSGRLVLASAPPKVRELLSSTMLLQVIPLYPDPDAARRAQQS